MNIPPEKEPDAPGKGPGWTGMNGAVTSETKRMATSLSASMRAMKTFRQPLVDYLISGLEDNDKWVRVMAAEMLGILGDSHSAEHLKPLLAGWDSDLRIVAAKSLAMIRSPRSAFALSQADNCGHCMIRLVANEALEKLKNGK